MSLAIDTETITDVLLADGWHIVFDGSFTLDSYEYLWSGQEGMLIKNMPRGYPPQIMHSGGNSGICATGFSFLSSSTGETGAYRIAGPLTAILAVRYGGSSL